jgi:hypothetical protein
LNNEHSLPETSSECLVGYSDLFRIPIVFDLLK